MKKLLTVLCILCFTGCAYAEMYELSGSRVETTTEVQVSDTGDKKAQKTKVKRKKIFRYKDPNPTNSYWNFGKVPFWTGSI